VRTLQPARNKGSLCLVHAGLSNSIGRGGNTRLLHILCRGEYTKNEGESVSVAETTGVISSYATFAHQRNSMNPTVKNNLRQIELWSKDVFLFADECMNMRPSDPIDELRGKAITYKDTFGIERSTILFDVDGNLTYPDLAFYTVDMFKNQSRGLFKKYKGTRFTWQQTVELEAYNRAINTFDKDSFDAVKRWISIKSGHGIGKTSFLSVVSLHFLICYFGSQIGVTANTEDQLKDIFLKELSYWRMKLPQYLQDNIEVLDDFVRVSGEKDWFLRARVARPEKPEALAGLHGKFILVLVDEASAVHNKVFEVMKGALTGYNYIVIYTSNPTRTEGEFFDSHKKGAAFTQLSFNTRHSPIVEEGYIEKMEADYGKGSDEVLIRVDGEFAGLAEMDDKGWIPLFANMTILFEAEQGQIINRGVIGVDPAGKGRDRSIVHIRDTIYLKEVLNETTSHEKDLARKIETIRDAYNCSSNDIGVEAFGLGAKVVANIQTKMGENVMAILTDKPREEVKDKYHTYRSELGWLLREWLSKGGIIITNNGKEWLREMEKMKYKRDAQGRVMLMDKVTFKKEYGFSPDRFDAACMTFFKDEPTMPVHLTKAQLETKENAEWLRRAQEAQRVESVAGAGQNYSSM